MENRGDRIIETETQASAGSKDGVMRWVLGIGLVLAVVAMALVWLGGMSQNETGTQLGDVSEQIEQDKAQNDGLTDSIAAGQSDQMSAGKDQKSYNGALEIEQNKGATGQ